MRDLITPIVTVIVVWVVGFTAIALLALSSSSQDPACPDGMESAYIDKSVPYISDTGEHRVHPATIHTCQEASNE